MGYRIHRMTRIHRLRSACLPGWIRALGYYETPGEATGSPASLAAASSDSS
jgi:hypothetical protein